MRIDDARVLRLTLTDAEAEAMVRDYLMRSGHLREGDVATVTWCQSLLPHYPTGERGAMFITVSQPNIAISLSQPTKETP